MHIDLNTLDALPTTPLASQVCIIGGGIAGLLLAQRLAARGLSIHLLEGGGLELEEQSQALYNAEMAGAAHTGTTAGRFRTFGGSSTRWGGQLLPFTADIFQPPAGLPSAPWPLTAAELEAFYPEIERIMGVDTLPFTDALLPGRRTRSLAPQLSPDLLLRFSKWAPFSRRNLAHTVGRPLLDHPRVTLYTHANAAELLSSSAGRITGLRVLDFRGRTLTFSASFIIVATGTIESSRLLLSSPTALPNTNDQLGRYFHDHVSLHAARLQPTVRDTFLQHFGPRFTGNTLRTAKLEATPALREREDLLACMAHLVIEEPEDSGAAAVRRLLRSVQQGQLREAIGSNLRPMLHGSVDIARLLYAARVQHRRAVSSGASVFLNIDLEQPGKANNRIRLSSATDSLGLPRAIVDWRTGPRERLTTQRFARFLQHTFTGVGLPQPTWLPGILEGESLAFADTYHPMGGLRMGTDAATSVVNPDLRVHTLDNLYVASCSTFPSGGSSNPTFTLMALSLRLADHLAARLA